MRTKILVSFQTFPHSSNTDNITESDDRILFPRQHHGNIEPPRHTKDHDPLDNTDTSLHTQAYSWEWGAFPQPSPIQTHFTTSFIKGKAKALDTVHDEPDENERILTRSRSVPPELEASPHSVHTSLPSLDSDHDHDNYPPRERRPSACSDTDTFGSGGRLTALCTDPTKFRVSIHDGMSIFELSLVERREVFHGDNEVEAACVFDAGLVDYHRFVGDDSIVSDTRLVIKWNGGQYITREDESPLMNALKIWRQSSATDGLVDDPPTSPSPPQEEFSPASLAYDTDQPKRSGPEPLVPPSRQLTSSSWVRWWSRSRDISIAEQPPLREAATIPFNTVSAQHSVNLHNHPYGHVQKLPTSTLSTLRTHASASAPPGTPAPPQSPITKPVDVLVPTQPQTQKRYAKTLRLTSDQLVKFL